MHKKRPKICTCCRFGKAKFYLYHSFKIAKAGPGFDDRPEHPSVQINSSSPACIVTRKEVANIDNVSYELLNFCAQERVFSLQLFF
jgi:hypothetical protein